MESEVVNKVQPNDTIAEQAVLGSMLVDTEAVIAAVEILKPEDFYREDNREIYAAMLEIYSLGKHIDMITLMEQLRLRGTLERVGDSQYIATLIDNVPTTSNIENYVKIVEEKSVLRKLIKTSNDIIKLSYSQTEEVDSIIEQAEKQVFDVVQNRNSKGYSSMKEILVTAFDMIENMYQNKNKVSGIESGFIDLDNKISGLNPSDLIIVAARPAMGKSAFVLNIANFVAMHMKTPVMIFSLEMSKEQMVTRILSSESEIDSMKLRNANFDSEDWLKLGETSGKLTDVPLYIDDTPGLSASELRAKCRKAKLEKGIGLVIIDYLQLMESKSRGNTSRQQEISDISRSLKILAKELKVPVIALSQLSRATESRTDHRPMLSDLRESGAIEQDADIVMFLHREDYYDPETEKKNVAEVIIAKNRNGETGTVELAWLGQYTKFANLYRGPEA
ncbi:MAG: replicative DNA helicase [Clostridia bacterium]|nr:replicative DNA helicase [Clostridia bacterium]